MSTKSAESLSLVVWHEKQNAWPHAVPRCDWQGSLDATWDKYVGENIVPAPIGCLVALKEFEKQLELKRGYTFVYLWRFCVINRVFFKVGITGSLLGRFKTFRSLIPAPVMSDCEVHKLSVVRTGYNSSRAADIERNFIVACRKFYLNNEWLDFEVG